MLLRVTSPCGVLDLALPAVGAEGAADRVRCWSGLKTDCSTLSVVPAALMIGELPPNLLDPLLAARADLGAKEVAGPSAHAALGLLVLLYRCTLRPLLLFAELFCATQLNLLDSKTFMEYLYFFFSNSSYSQNHKERKHAHTFSPADLESCTKSQK